MLALFFFLVGLFFGSFFNVIIDRVPREESIVVGRSHCDFCGHVLSWYDLFPLFSFLFLFGKCRYCHAFIGWKYPVIEFITGVSFASAVYFSSLASPFLLLVMLGIISCLIIVFFTDLFSGIIPDSVLGVLFLLSLIRIGIVHAAFFPALLSGMGAGLFFLLIFLFTKGKGIGFGDVKYAAVMGLLLGFPFIITGLYLTFLTGACLALILIMAKKKRFKEAIALGPFLVVGTIANIFWGQALWVLFLHITGI